MSRDDWPAVCPRASRSPGVNVLYLGDRIEGEAREVAKVHAAIALEIASPACREGLPCEWKAAATGTLVEATLTTSGRGIRPTEVVEVLLPGVSPWDRLDRVLRTTQWIERPEATCAPFGVRIRKELDNERQLTDRERR